MTRKEATNYYRRLSNCIKRKRFCVKLQDRGAEYGAIDWGEPDVMIINPRRRSPVVRTIIHELLHLMNDNLLESEVLALEKELFEAMSDRQLEGLCKKVFAHDLDMVS